MTKLLACLAVAALTAAAGCDGDPHAPGPTEDTTQPDVAVDVTADATPDAVVDGVVDAVPDAAPDVAVDAQPDAEPDAAPDVPVDVPLAPCEPALSITPGETSVLPYSLTVLSVSGGTGAYSFELTTDASGALVNDLTGAYVAGGVVAVDDVVTVTDAGCIGSAEATIHVVPTMAITPSDPVVPPNASFDFTVQGGSGDVTFELVVGTSGGSVTPGGTYTAGSSDGTDSIQASDNVTGDTAVVTVNVITGATLTPSPAQLFVAVGNTQVIGIDSGSGLYGFNVANEGIATVDAEGRLVGVAPGDTTLGVTDQATGASATIDVQVVSTPVAPNVRTGDGTDWGSFAIGDVDGDGIVDAVLGRDEMDVTGWNSGAVYVYKGTTSGLLPEPMQVLTVDARNMRFGRKVALADHNGDGVLDLFVSAFLADVGFSDNGAVYVHDGIADGGFATEPTYTFFGNSNSDYFGHGFVLCDFNADGLEDLAIGASLDENTQVDPTPSNQGAVSVFLQRPEGFLAAPDQTLWGDVPNDGSTSIDPDDDIRFGTELAAGDHNGDGACDLAVYAERYRTPGAPGTRTYDGAVLLFAGVPATESFVGGVTGTMVRALRGSGDVSDQSRFGRKMAFGDVTGDGTDDLLVGQYYHHDPAYGTRGGAARLFLGDGFAASAGIPAWEGPDDADWSVFGDSGYDYCGWDVGIVDADNSGPLDLIVSHPNGEKTDGVSNGGLLTIHLGVTSGLPSVEPNIVIGSDISGDPRFGSAFGFLGDIDGDLAGDYVVLASRDDALGYDVGQPYYVPGTAITTPSSIVALELEGEPSGMQFGRASAVVGDVTGNGHPDLVVGAPYGDLEGEGLNSGRLFLYEGEPGGFATTHTMELSTFAQFSSGDSFGWGVAPAGRFDGDANDDFAIVGYLDDRPSSLPGTAMPVGSCPTGSESNPGSVAIFAGGSPTLETDEPAFLIYGLEGGQYTESLAGGFDINGDGLSDIAMGSRYLDDGGASNGGGFQVVLGRPRPDPAMTGVICDSAYTFRSYETNAYLAFTMAPLGDVNGDGCDELAIAGYGYDWDNWPGADNQGGVYVLFGWGPTCTQTTPKMVALAPLINTGMQAGIAIAGGFPVDGADMIPDLVVGAHVDSIGGSQTGSAWLISGAYIASLEGDAEALVDGQAPTTVHPFEPVGSGDVMRVYGTAASERFGRAVALIPGAGSGGRALVAVGSYLGNLGGIEQSGGATIFRGANGGGLNPTPLAVFGGETTRAGSYVGFSMHAGALSSGAALVVGGIYGSSFGLDQGSAHVLTF